MALQPGNKQLQYTYCPIPQEAYSDNKKTNIQTIKFGQLLEYNVRNTFFEKSYKKRCV